MQKQRAATVLKKNKAELAEAKKNLADAKKRGRSKSRSHSSEPTVSKNKGKARKSHK